MSKVNVSTTDLDHKIIQRIDIDQNAQRVTVFHKNSEKELKVGMTIYMIAGENRNVHLKKILEVNEPDFRYEQILWSKINGHFCLFDKRGNFRFGILKEKHEQKKGQAEIIKYDLELIGKDISNGNQINYANWDPSGRFLAVFVERDSRVYVYNLFGDIAFSLNEDKATQFIWRPRMQTNVTKEEEDKIRKNQKKTFEIYNDEDSKILNENEYLEKQKIKALHDKFFKYMNLGRKRWDECHEQRCLTLGWDEDVIDDPVTVEIIDKTQLIEEVQPSA